MPGKEGAFLLLALMFCDLNFVEEALQLGKNSTSMM